MAKNRIDFLIQVVNLLDNQEYYATVISPMLLTDNSIAVLPMPVNNYDHYMDGSYRQQFAFQVSTKHTDQLKAYKTLQDITNFLIEVKDIPSKEDSYKFEEMKVVLDPNLIGRDEKSYEFGAQFNASLFIQN